MSTNPHKAKHWGLLVGETVKPLPRVRGAADAYVAAAKSRPAAEVVYRHDSTSQWRMFSTDTEVPTQLEFDWTTA
ncbi:hypothetical protein [Nocardia sp. AG03]|uniref:hypothetical protein n=1 Tax=Nocardia sp. AG03 TaxID=3025312 RepID=UPI0024187683|nr:hypothetical protein [Nocardia sp. AG03]